MVIMLEFSCTHSITCPFSYVFVYFTKSKNKNVKPSKNFVIERALDLNQKPTEHQKFLIKRIVKHRLEQLFFLQPVGVSS